MLQVNKEMLDFTAVELQPHGYRAEVNFRLSIGCAGLRAERGIAATKNWGHDEQPSADVRATLLSEAEGNMRGIIGQAEYAQHQPLTYYGALNKVCPVHTVRNKSYWVSVLIGTEAAPCADKINIGHCRHNYTTRHTLPCKSWQH